ncbi:X-Pro dipeptidyl-peptidase [Portibacter lacus]|uniref:X-Pro dipeptidyl-peptidase n=2 Tax=Portibacter lacus TaxID=1099794 RepID=A0AA37SQH0_9BACT|nr:X-Pro dipeptidyl-peptidase [Portibacter lacus]
MCSFQSISSQQISTTKAPVSELYDFSVNINEDIRSLYRFYVIYNSPERRERFENFYNEKLVLLNSYNFDELSIGGKVDYLLLKNKIEDQLFNFSTEEMECRQVEEWVKFGSPIYEVEKLRRRGIKQDAQALANQLNTINKQANEILVKLDKTEKKFPRNLAERASGIVYGYTEAIKSVVEFYSGYDVEFSWWVTKPAETLLKTLDELQKKFEASIDESTFPKDDGSGIIGSPIGREELIRQLQLEMIPYSPEELVEIAMKEFAWCDKELLKASNEMGFGDDWKAAQEKVKMAFVPAGEQPEAMLELYNQSVAFLKEHDLLTIPPLAEETWRMKMISPERQLISPFFLGGEVLQISYPTDEMEHDDKMMSMRGNNPHFSRATVHHELIAGHHLQQFVNNRNHEYRNYRTPFWTEGWALYWELTLWDMDFPRGPEDKIGMLFWRMHRCARIIFSLNYHLGEWTPQQCIDYLVDRVGHERANAEGEVRRSFTGNYGPLYQIAYMVGGLQFRALKEELVDSGQMTYKEFHDAVLEENTMPVEMVRAILTNQALTKDFKSNWRFYKN